MPNKTIYVSDDDLKLFQRAQELAGGNLSAAIATAMRRYVETEEGRQEGYDEIVVKVGAGARRKQRFVGVLLGEWGTNTKNGSIVVHRVYRSRTGKFVLYIDRSPEWSEHFESGTWMNWRNLLGVNDSSWGFIQGEATLQVFDTLDELQDLVPAELYDMVATLADQPAVEDLDI